MPLKTCSDKLNYDVVPCPESPSCALFCYQIYEYIHIPNAYLIYTVYRIDNYKKCFVVHQGSPSSAVGPRGCGCGGTEGGGGGGGRGGGGKAKGGGGVAVEAAAMVPTEP